MSITKGPIFKSIMFALAVVYVTLITQSVWAANRDVTGKPGIQSSVPLPGSPPSLRHMDS